MKNTSLIMSDENLLNIKEQHKFNNSHSVKRFIFGIVAIGAALNWLYQKEYIFGLFMLLCSTGLFIWSITIYIKERKVSKNRITNAWIKDSNTIIIETFMNGQITIDKGQVMISDIPNYRNYGKAIVLEYLNDKYLILEKFIKDLEDFKQKINYT